MSAARVLRLAWPSLATGVVVGAGAVLAFAVTPSRAVPAGALAALVTALALAVPTPTPLVPNELPAVPQSSGYHPAGLLASALARAAADPDGVRRVRSRLADLAEAALAHRGLSVDQALRDGLLSPSTVALLGLADPPPGAPWPGRASPVDLRRCIDEVTALVGEERHDRP